MKLHPTHPAVLALTLTSGCAQTTTERLNLPAVRSVESIDLNRYTGTWYEIASYPQRFQEGCTGTTATYTLQDDGTISVLNRCRRDSLEGPEVTANGRARVVNAARPSELEVSFFRPFWGDYWVIDLDPEYRFAVVGQPSRDYLWILSRTPTLPSETYQGILNRLVEQEYPLEPLVQTLQPGETSGSQN